MIHLKTLRLAAILVALLTVFAVRTAQAMPTTTAAIQCGKWNVVASPPIILGVSQLNAVAAASATDVWAVGDSDGLSQTLIEQWNGSSWQIITSPNVNTYNALYGLTAISAQDVWAVGFSGDINDVNQTLIEHWDGSKWSIIPSPNHAGSQNDILTSVSAVSTTDIWAVGYYGTEAYTTQYTLTEHWDGTAWSIVPSSNVDKGGDASTELYGVSAVASNDVWAVGYDNILDYHAVIEHWDGSHWRISFHPNIGAQLHAVVGISSSDAWAVGTSVGAQPFTVQWNGKHWHIVQTPAPQGMTTLNGIAASGANNVWSVGGVARSVTKPITEHWNGTAWKLVASPNLNHGGQLFAVTITSSSQVWSVGSYALNKNRTVFDPLIEYYC